VSADGILTVSFRLDKDHMRRFNFSSPVPHTVYQIYVGLGPDEFKAKDIPDGNNPRSHDNADNVARDIMKKIRHTLTVHPERFGSVNRGGLAIVQSASYDPVKGIFTCHLTDWQKGADDLARPKHGLADGGTTDLIIYEMQQEAADLSQAKLHLEIMVFADVDPDDIDMTTKMNSFVEDICEARNTSRQVKGWSMENWRGDWKWLKHVLEPVYPGRVAYEEYGDGDVTVLDVLAILNLFRLYYNGKKAPTVSYSSKGRMLTAFQDSRESFEMLSSVIVQILDLHDYIYSTFNTTYAAGSKRSFRRYVDAVRGTKLFQEHNPPRPLVFGPYTAELEVDKGFLFPVVAAFRALLDFDDGKVQWFTDPKPFWDAHGDQLMEQLVEAMGTHQKDPQSVGKDSNVYRYLWGTVHTIRQDEEMKRLRAQLAQR
jgi:hypothetical protein